MSYVHEIARKKGIPVVDAKEHALIGVAVDDIRKASAKNSKCCAFARAAQKEPGVVAAYFFKSMAFIEYIDRMVRYALPGAMTREIVSFDRAGVMAPGEYKLKPPPPSQSIRAIKQYAKVGKKKLAKKRAAAVKKVAARLMGDIDLPRHLGTVRSEMPLPELDGLRVRRRNTPKYVRTTAEP